MIPFIDFHNNPIRYYRANLISDHMGLFILLESPIVIISEKNENMNIPFPDRCLVITAFSVHAVHKMYLRQHIIICL